MTPRRPLLALLLLAAALTCCAEEEVQQQPQQPEQQQQEQQQQPPDESKGLTVVITALGPDLEIRAIKAAREVAGTGLAETRRRLQALPWEIRTGLTRQAAQALQARLSEAGLTAEIRTP